MAYVAQDGTPRNVPIASTGNGSKNRHEHCEECSALRKNQTVALRIDIEVHPPKILLLRAQAELDVVDGTPKEFLELTSPTT